MLQTVCAGTLLQRNSHVLLFHKYHLLFHYCAKLIVQDLFGDMLGDSLTSQQKFKMDFGIENTSSMSLVLNLRL